MVVRKSIPCSYTLKIYGIAMRVAGPDDIGNYSGIFGGTYEKYEACVLEWRNAGHSSMATHSSDGECSG